MESLRYPPSSDATWHVFLYGNVPGHQLDWIWRPANEGGPSQLHVQHLHALVQLFDVPDPSLSTLTIGNLSLGDTRHMPGRGALAVLSHFRLPGAQDHSGRPNPPLVVAIVAVDRDLRQDSIEAAARTLRRLTDGGRPAGERPIDAWYARYVEAADDEAAARVWQLFMAGFETLPALGSGRGGRSWVVPEGAAFPASLDLQADVEPERALSAMAGLGEVLYRSRARWSAITDARPTQEIRDQGALIRVASDRAPGAAPRLSQLPQDAAALAMAVLPVMDEAHEITTLPVLEDLGTTPPPPVVPAPVPAAQRPIQEGVEAALARTDSPFRTLTPDESDELLDADGQPLVEPGPPPVAPVAPVEPEPASFWQRWWALFLISGVCALIAALVVWKLGDDTPPPVKPPASGSKVAAPPVANPPVETPPVETPPVEIAPPELSPVEAPVPETPRTASGSKTKAKQESEPAAVVEPATITETSEQRCHLERAGGGPRVAIVAGLTVRPATYDLYCEPEPGAAPEKMVSTALASGRSYKVKCRGNQCRLTEAR